jgi:predicted enzyme related to lactoylglutathione lyase
MKRDQAPFGAPCWIELHTTDSERSRSFYADLFGWEASEPQEQFGGYFNSSLDGVLVAGGIADMVTEGNTNTWITYLASKDARATAEAFQANGGTIVAEAMDVMDLGVMAVGIDPGGATIGIWQPGTHKGFGVLAEPNAPGWFELQTRAYDESVAFYEKVFGWDTHVTGDSPEFRYTTLGEGEGQLAGIMDASGFLPEGEPAYWGVYFVVADTDKAIEQATGLGATVIDAAVDTPYGRLATLTDPTGTRIKLVSDQSQG